MSSLACEACDATPTAHFVFTQLTAYVVARNVRTVDRHLCRDCARAIGRTMQSRTLITGWWGIFAFVHNLGAVALNAVGLRRAEALSPPTRAGYAEANVPTLDPGKPVFQRPGGILLSLVLSASIIANVVSSGSHNQPEAPQQASPASVTGYAVGVCLSRTFDDQAAPVECLSQHDGKIVGWAITADSCAVTTEAYVEEGSGVWCVDEDA